MTFHLLNQSINKALTLCGYEKPTPIQEQTIPVVLEGKDLVASSQTGSGKTAAFVLPALHRLSLGKSHKKPRILILTPTRELASQIQQAARDFSRFTRVNIINLVGGMAYGPQIRDLARGTDVIVATPGRLVDHIDSKRVDLSQIEMLVLDEADRMLDMGFIDDVEYIAKLTPKAKQTLLFSATVDKKLTTVVRHLLKDPVRVDLSPEKMTPTQIKQELYRVSSAPQKTRLLKHFLHEAQIYKAIIFSATKINADRLAEQLRDDGFSAAALHGDLRQNVRNRTIAQMRHGKIQYLVATDVAARGIDIDDISHVINYDLPRFCEDYVHRIGRTGRAGREGVAISFVLPQDQRHLKSIERYLGQRLTVKDHAIKSEHGVERSHEKHHHDDVSFIREKKKSVASSAKAERSAYESRVSTRQNEKPREKYRHNDAKFARKKARSFASGAGSEYVTHEPRTSTRRDGKPREKYRHDDVSFARKKTKSFASGASSERATYESRASTRRDGKPREKYRHDDVPFARKKTKSFASGAQSERATYEPRGSTRRDEKSREHHRHNDFQFTGKKTKAFASAAGAKKAKPSTQHRHHRDDHDSSSHHRPAWSNNKKSIEQGYAPIRKSNKKKDRLSSAS